MSIMLTPYDTFACHGFLMKKTVDALEDAFVMGHLVPSEDDPRVLLVEGGAAIVDQVPSFRHPLFINPRNEEQGYIVTDVRFFGKYDKISNSFRVRNATEYSLAQYRAKLTRIWGTEFPTILQNVSDIPMAVYASWLSELISHKFSLEPREQMALMILCAYFYSCLFMEDQELDESSRLKLAGRISRAIRTGVQNVTEVIDDLPVISGIKQFCELAPTVTGSIRLTKLNPGMLYTITGGSWFGVKAEEVIATAIEHPPTWLAIVLSAYKDRSYRNTSISKIAERSGNRGAGEQFVRSIDNLIRTTNS